DGAADDRLQNRDVRHEHPLPVEIQPGGHRGSAQRRKGTWSGSNVPRPCGHSMPEFVAAPGPGFLPDQWNESTGEVVADNRPIWSANDLLQDLVLFGADRNHQPPARL